MLLSVQISSLNYLQRLFNMLSKTSFIIYKRIGNRMLIWIKNEASARVIATLLQWTGLWRRTSFEADAIYIVFSEWKINIQTTQLAGLTAPISRPFHNIFSGILTPVFLDAFLMLLQVNHDPGRSRAAYFSFENKLKMASPLHKLN